MYCEHTVHVRTAEELIALEAQKRNGTTTAMTTLLMPRVLLPSAGKSKLGWRSARESELPHPQFQRPRTMSNSATVTGEASAAAPGSGL
jgi:hypothetical protein